MVGWAMFSAEAVKIVEGKTKIYSSSEHGRRHFCADCGSGLFYTNDQVLPGIMDVQSATFDMPESLPPRAQIQVAERIGWMQQLHELPMFDRFPS
jgi:hypothetical protein